MANPFTSKEEDGFLENLKEADWGGLAQNIGEGLRDEFTGIDDYIRAVKYAAKGDFLRAAKSYYAGNIELATTLATFGVGSGALAGAKAGLKAAQFGVKGARAGRAARVLKSYDAAKAAKVAGAAKKISAKRAAFSPMELSKVLRGLTLDEQAAAKALGRAGAKRNLVSRASEPIEKEAAELFAKNFDTELDIARRAEFNLPPAIGTAKRKIGDTTLRRATAGIGTGRGGIAGTVTRGIAVLGGAPGSQGRLARSAARARYNKEVPSFGARIGESVSGKYPVLTKTGLDPVGMAMARRQGPAMTPYGITQEQYDQLQTSLNPTEFNILLQVLQEQAQQGAVNG